MRIEKSAQEGGKGLNGGGLAVGALYDLNSVLISQGNDEVECITIEVNTEDTRLRCFVGYEPQISDSPTRKELFWEYIDHSQLLKRIILKFNSSSIALMTMYIS